MSSLWAAWMVPIGTPFSTPKQAQDCPHLNSEVIETACGSANSRSPYRQGFLYIQARWRASYATPHHLQHIASAFSTINGIGHQKTCLEEVSRRLHPSSHFMSCVCRFFDFDKLREVTKLATRNLNKIIDVNYYPVDTAKRSNMRHRPIGLGVQVKLQSRTCLDLQLSLCGLIICGQEFDGSSRKFLAQKSETSYLCLICACSFKDCYGYCWCLTSMNSAGAGRHIHPPGHAL